MAEFESMTLMFNVVDGWKDGAVGKSLFVMKISLRESQPSMFGVVSFLLSLHFVCSFCPNFGGGWSGRSKSVHMDKVMHVFCARSSQQKVSEGRSCHSHPCTYTCLALQLSD